MRPILSRIRMTTRSLMIVVLFASLLLGAFVMLRRAAHDMRLAAFHERLAHHLHSKTGASEAPKLADHHEKLARQYERAAARPWLSVDPETSE